MPRQVYTAVVERNVTWQGDFTTEPYEAGWASEALIFIRTLQATGPGLPATARVQLSPDGIHWIDEGTTVLVPTATEGLGVARVQQFGNWLRLAGSLPLGQQCTVIVYFVLKE